MILVIMGAFSSQLKISGTSNIASNFNVKITNIQSSVQNGQASNASDPSYIDTTAIFKTNLVSSGDAMKYDITVSNGGTIDAVLESIDVNTGDNDAITFQTSGIKQGDKLQVSQTDVLTVIVSYNSSVTSQPENTSSTIIVTLNYKQDDGTIETVPEVPATDPKYFNFTYNEGDKTAIITGIKDEYKVDGAIVDGDTKITNIVIPKTVQYNGEDYSVTVIASSSFAGTALQEVYIPLTVTVIGNGAFAMCENLKTITINNVEGSIAFGDNWNYNVTAQIIWLKNS